MAVSTIDGEREVAVRRPAKLSSEIGRVTAVKTGTRKPKVTVRARKQATCLHVPITDNPRVDLVLSMAFTNPFDGVIATYSSLSPRRYTFAISLAPSASVPAYVFSIMEYLWSPWDFLGWQAPLRHGMYPRDWRNAHVVRKRRGHVRAEKLSLWQRMHLASILGNPAAGGV